MTPLDVALHDEAARIVARDELEARHREAAHMKHCTMGRCRCRTCAVTEALLRSELMVKHKARDFDARRVTVRANDFAGGAHPYIATVRIDGREVYRIHDRPDEVFAPDVLDDIIKGLRRPM
jgi:hypothetical protein